MCICWWMSCMNIRMHGATIQIFRTVAHSIILWARWICRFFSNFLSLGLISNLSSQLVLNFWSGFFYSGLRNICFKQLFLRCVLNTHLRPDETNQAIYKGIFSKWEFQKYFRGNESSLWPGQLLSFQIHFLTSWNRKLTSFYGRSLLDSWLSHISLVIILLRAIFSKHDITSSKWLHAEEPYCYLISFIACQTRCPS